MYFLIFSVRRPTRKEGYPFDRRISIHLRVDEVCKHSYMFSNPSIQPGHECFVITGMVNSCYGPYSLLSISNMLVE